MSVPANFKSAMQSAAVTIASWLEIEGLPVCYGTMTQGSSFFSGRSATQQFTAIKSWLVSAPKSVAQTVDTLKGGSLSAGQMNFQIIDYDGSITALTGEGNLTGSTNLAAACAVGDTTLHPSSTSGFSNGQIIYIGSETVKIGTISGGNFTGCTRGMYRSTPQAFGIGALIGVTPYVMAMRRVWYNQVALAGVSRNLTSTDPDRAIRFTGILTNFYTADAGANSFVFEAASIDKEIDNNILNNLRAFNLSTATPIAAIGGSPGNSKNEIWGFQIGTNAPFKFINQEVLLLRIGDEILLAHYIAADNAIQILIRGLMNTIPADHSPGDLVQELCSFMGFVSGSDGPSMASKFTYAPTGVNINHPLALLLQFLCSTGNATNGNYDTLPAFWGLGVSASRIDITGWETLMYEEPTLSFGGVIDSSMNFVDLMRSLLTMCGYYYLVTMGDSLTVRRLRPPRPDVPSRALTDSNRIRTFATKWEANWNAAVSQVVFQFGYDIVHSKYKRITVLNIPEATLYSKGLARTVVFDCKWLYPGATGIPGEPSSMPFDVDQWLLIRKDFYRTRYAKPPPIFRERSNWQLLDCEIGDYFLVTAKNPPNVGSGTRGVTASLCEIIAKDIDDQGKFITWTLLNTGWQVGQYRFIAPSASVVSRASNVFTLASGSGPHSDGNVFSVVPQGDEYSIDANSNIFDNFPVGTKIWVWAVNMSSFQRGTVTAHSATSLTATADSGSWGSTPAGSIITLTDYALATTAAKALYAFEEQTGGGAPTPGHVWFPT